MANLAIQDSLQTLRDLLIEEGRFLYEVSSEVEEVESELDTIRSFLIDVDKWPDRYNPASLRDWICKLENLASRAEYATEKYAVAVATKRGGNLKKKIKRFTCILSEFSTVHHVGKEIEAVRSSLSVLTGRLGSIAPAAGGSSSTNNHKLERRETYGHEVEQHFVGMEKDIASLVSLVKDRSRRNRVISIYGMGGLGKTTLARKIYQHKDVVDVFAGARAWVCITQQFETKTVISQILEQLLPDGDKARIGSMGQHELVKALHDFQMQKRCLVVIDDIWETRHWTDKLKPAFPIENGDCKVLLTTRNKELVGPQERLYELHCLTEDQGWDLLRKIALPREPETEQRPSEASHHAELETEQNRGEVETEQAQLEVSLDVELETEESSPEASRSTEPGIEESPLEAIGREMVRKCGRLPLAISALGGVLCNKQTSDEWERVNKQIDTTLLNGEGVVENEEVKQVLDLSYNVLPYYLKMCFLYLGCFREDEEIDTERLYLLWMAEGLIYSEGKGKEETLRDVAERYLNELAVRSMVQVQKHEFSSAYNKFKSCRLHDLMRDLCLSKGEEKGFKLIGFRKPTKHDTFVGSSCRLAIHCDGAVDDYFNEEEEKNKNLRSLLLFQKESSRALVIGSKDSVTNFSKLKRLRILALENGEFVLPNEVGMLIHLRYLSLFNSQVKELPVSVSNLPYLQTLDLRVLDLLILPNVIFKMKRLRHLFLKLILVTGKHGDLLILDGLNELETLQGSNSYWVRCADIPKLINLQNLSADVYDNDSLSMIVLHMQSNGCQLRETRLNIWSCDFNSEKGSNTFSEMLMSHSLISLQVHGRVDCKFPCYRQGLCTNLVDLSLHNTEIEGEELEIMGKFPMLKRLELDGRVFMKTEMRCLATSFPQLKYLLLNNLYNLERWVVDKGAMPNLLCLQIGFCQKLKMIPDGLRFIATLQELSCLCMPKTFNDRLRVVNGQQGEDYLTFSYIPSILLEDFD